MRARHFMALGFVVLAIALVVIQVTQPVGFCGENDGRLRPALLTAAAATLLLVVGILAAVKWRSKWEAVGCSVALVVVAGGLLLYWLVGRLIDPCLA